MEKKKIIENVILLIILIALIIVAVLLPKENLGWNRKKKVQNEVENEVSLTKIAYSQVESKGYHNADGVLQYFVMGYNNHDGSEIASMMDLVAAYIYKNEADKDINKFDEKYEEILSDPDGYSKTILMVSELKLQEENIISSINNTNVKIVVKENSEIEDVTKYVSKMTATIKTVSLAEEAEYVNTVEFLLLHEGEAYYIFDYYAIDDGGNKIE